jgi:hypothetical protein
MSCCIYFLSILSVVDPAAAGLKEGKKTPRDGLSYPTPDSDLFERRRALQESHQLVKTRERLPEPPIQVQETLSASLRYERQSASVVPMRVNDPDRSPLAIHS